MGENPKAMLSGHLVIVEWVINCFSSWVSFDGKHDVNCWSELHMVEWEDEIGTQH